MEELQNIVNESVEHLKAQVPEIKVPDLTMSEWIYYMTMPAIILISAAASFRLWLKLNIILAFFFGGLMILYPEGLLSITLNAELDTQLRFVASLYGCYEIFNILFVVFMLPSKDESIFISFLWANLIKFTLYLNDNYISVMSTDKWNYKLLIISGSTSIAMILTSIYFLLITSNKRAQFHYKMYPINRFAKIDFYMLFNAGILLYAYPRYILEKLDIDNYHSGHESLFKIAGIVTMSMAFQSFAVPSFLFEKDKMRFILARLSGGLVELITVFYGYFILKAITTKAFCILAGLNLFYDSFITLGYLCCVKKLEELKSQAGFLSTSSVLNDSDIVYAEVTTNIVEEVIKVNPITNPIESETPKDK